MKIEEVVELLKDIKGLYGKFEINERTPKMWFNFLEGESTKHVRNRLEQHAKASRFEPTIHDLISHSDPELESRYEEIARNQWIAKGNDPSEFKYKPTSGD